MGETNLIDHSIDVIKNNIHNDYEFILFTRADIFLKPYFSNIFYKNHNKIRYIRINTNRYKFILSIKCSSDHFFEGGALW